jgi:hypothetical protein
MSYIPASYQNLKKPQNSGRFCNSPPTGTAKRSWILPQGHFGLSVRPAFGPTVLSVYVEGERLAGKGEFAAARERWVKIPTSVGPGYPWLKSWLLLRLAQILNKDRQLRDADGAYREALEEARRLKSFLSP